MKEETFKAQAQEALSKCQIIDNQDGTIDVTGDLKISFPFHYLPKIRNLNGEFICQFNHHLKTLKRSPISVTGNFNCAYSNQLTTLDGAPEYVGGDFFFYRCDHLKTL